MKDLPTTVSLVILTLVALAASVLAILSSRAASKEGGVRRFSRSILVLTWLCFVGGAAVFVYRNVVIHQQWQPLQAHVDGLPLVAALLAAMILYLQGIAHVRGLSVFALPMLTLIFAWAICASSWTFAEFVAVDSAWKTFHLGSVYAGMLFFAIASIAGVMYLHVQRQLRNPQSGSSTRPFASLETIERLIIRTAAIGFALLTIGLITGLVIVTSDPNQRLGAGWWYSPKVVLAGAVWVIYAIVMNVKYTTNFRGARAAWLSIAGLVLLLATFGVATALTPSSAKVPNDGKASESVPAENKDRQAEPVSLESDAVHRLSEVL